MRSRRAGWNLRAALVAALMLVLQTVVGAYAIGVGPGELDTFGNPLCLSSVGQSDPGKTGDHGSLPNCCTLGCPMVAQALGSPPEAASLPADLPLDAGIVPVVSPRLNLSPDDHQPGNPRAPPQTV
ncbi:hypothetical protein NKH71_11090 [Mesorhizobium sp. M0983]|uniref:hypothetical protein n=1 Tax=Mesorhizobium sp. M0983 TaxID=2957040 RepID=UPI00333BFBA8